MNLVSKSSFLFHSKNVMRLGVMLVITSMIVSWVTVPKAKAVAVVDDVALGAAATAAYLTSTGIPLTVTAGGASAASAGIVAVAGEYAAATGAAASGEALLTTIAAGTTLTAAGAVVLTSAAAVAVGALAYWAYNKYFVDSSSNSTVVYSSGNTGIRANLADGTSLKNYNCQFGVTYTLENGFTFLLSKDIEGGLSIILNGVVVKTVKASISSTFSYYGFGGFVGFVDYYYSDGSCYYCDDLTTFNNDMWYVQESSLSLSNIDYTPIPEIAPAKQLELDIAAPPELEVADVPEFAFEKVASGGWSQPTNVPHSVTSADPDPVPDPDPDPADPGSGDPTVPEDTPDVDDLGLPELGAALTTRFPFSIPWDIYRGLKLLSAPAEVPKFEVDFFAPLNNRVGGWKGDTKIVIDFGYYPEFSFIGELCRWTSTIGYCLFLASATKRFIWTA